MKRTRSETPPLEGQKGDQEEKDEEEQGEKRGFGLFTKAIRALETVFHRGKKRRRLPEHAERQHDEIVQENALDQKAAKRTPVRPNWPSWSHNSLETSFHDEPTLFLTDSQRSIEERQKALHITERIRETSPDTHVGSKEKPITLIDKQNNPQCLQPEKVQSEMQERDSNRVVEKPALPLEWFGSNQIARGLRNYGATCFMNVVLITLAHCDPFKVALKESFLSHQHDKKTTSCLLCVVTKTLVDLLRDRENGVLPVPSQRLEPDKALLNSLGVKYNELQQEDAHEFFHQLVLYGLDASCREHGLNNKPGDVFRGKLKTTCRCTVCHGMFDSEEVFSELSLDIRDLPDTTIIDSLEQYFRSETLEAENAYKCRRCLVSVRGSRSASLESLPRVLVLHLKRFTGLQQKLTRRVYFEQQLRSKDSSWNGELFSVIVHTGASISSGHYTNFVRVEHSRWLKFDDAVVSHSSWEEVQRQEAYLLFYRQSV